MKTVLVKAFNIQGKNSYPEGIVAARVAADIIKGRTTYYVCEAEDDFKEGRVKFATHLAQLQADQAAEPKMYRSWFKRRLLPYATEIKAGKEADPMVEAYMDLLNEYKHVDVSLPDTIKMIQDCVKRIKKINPECTLTADILLLPRQVSETFQQG